MSDMFPKSTLLRPGHRPEQIDHYFETAHKIYDVGELDEMDSEDVRTATFDVILRDYQPQVVDAAPDRFEAAFLQHRHAAFVAKSGRQAWMSQITQLTTTLYPCLLRLADECFAPASGQGYDKTDVDTLMDRIAGHFGSNATLASSEVRGVVFYHARGNKAYGESSVDRYLTCVVEILLSIK